MTREENERIFQQYERDHPSRHFKHKPYDIRRNTLIRIARLNTSYWTSKVQNPIYIIGCARSGTSILTDLVAKHHDVANWSEAGLVWDPQGRYWSISKRETPPLWVDAVAFTKRWLRDNEPRRDEITATFGLFQWLKHKSFFLNKAPVNTFRVPQVLKWFPEARLIHIVHDGRAVTYSHIIRIYKKIEQYPEFHKAVGLGFSFEELAVRFAPHWKDTLEEVTRRDDELNLSQRNILLELTYEELCADKVAVLERICQHIGLDPAQFDPSVWNVTVDNRNHKWRENLSPQLANQITAIMEPLLTAHGYV